MNAVTLNLTPHTITVVRYEDGKKVEIPPSGWVLRGEEKVTKKGAALLPQVGAVSVVSKEISGLYLQKKDGSKMEFAPESSETIVGKDTKVWAIIVSSIILEAAGKEVRRWRWGAPKYVMAPDTGPDSVVRDDSGRIEAVKRFVLAY